MFPCGKILCKKIHIRVFIFKMNIGYVGGNEALMFRLHTTPAACLVTATQP